MVLLTNDNVVLETISSISELYNAYPELKVQADKFKVLPKKIIEKEHSLFVYQKEYAVVNRNDPGIRIIGSDDCTTCHTLIIRHPNGSSAVGHFDGSKGEVESIVNMIESLIECDGEADSFYLYVAGGYATLDKKDKSNDSSEKLSMKLLNFFTTCPFTFEIKLWCTCSCNTIVSVNGPQPIIYGMSMELSSGEVFPSHFPDQEPDIAIRSAFRTMSNEKMLEIYDFKDNVIRIPAFRGCPTSSEQLKKAINLPDNVFLKNFSTSPLVEPPYFCQAVRNSLQLLIDHPHPQYSLFDNGQPRVYGMDENGLWKLLKENQS